jgi:hypothetical protein
LAQIVPNILGRARRNQYSDNILTVVPDYVTRRHTLRWTAAPLVASLRLPFRGGGEFGRAFREKLDTVALRSASEDHVCWQQNFRSQGDHNGLCRATLWLNPEHGSDFLRTTVTALAGWGCRSSRQAHIEWRPWHWRRGWSSILNRDLSNAALPSDQFKDGESVLLSPGILIVVILSLH